MTSSKRHLNSEQQLAIQSVEGRLLILAGAGSGKTTVLTERIVYLIESCAIDPAQILGLTFTNKAALEMRERMAGMLSKEKAKKVTLCTFHSFCMQILRDEIHHLGFTKDFTLYDEKDLLRVLKGIAHEVLEHEGELPSMTTTLQAVSKANQKGESPLLKENSSWHDRFVSDVYHRLKASLRAYNALDFDHLLLLTVDLFKNHPEILDRYQERYRYIMIDEYQDTNPIQYQLAELLSSKYQNLCVVGDDDQAIYGWRGADVSNILHFGDAKTIKLEQNYRSSNTILKAANQIIQHNRSRHSKALWSQKGEGEKIEVFVAPSEKEEAEAIVGRIVKLKEQGIRWSDIAILYRSNLLSRELEVALLKARWKNEEQWTTGIPYEIFGGTEIYERREVKDLLAYVKAIANPLDQTSLMRVINLPRRGIGDTMLDKMSESSRQQKIPLINVFREVAASEGEWKEQFSQKATQSLRDFLSILDEGKYQYQQFGIKEATHWLLTRTNFKKSIEEDVKSDKMREFKWQNIEQFVESMPMSIDTSLADYVGKMTLEEEGKAFSTQQEGKEKVSLMTFHSAKGLEFEVCFLAGIEDHLIPHEKSLLETGVEEERRLMYVAVTRAKNKLFISMTKQRKRMGKEAASKPSRFLFEIPKELLNPVAWHQI